MAARIVSIDGPFNSRVLVDMSADDARELFGDEPFSTFAPSDLRESVERDLRRIAQRDEELAGGTLAATARALAIRLENPYTSATAASMCFGKLIETMAQLRELCPPEEKKGALHGIRASRSLRLVEGQSGA